MIKTGMTLTYSVQTMTLYRVRGGRHSLCPPWGQESSPATLGLLRAELASPLNHLLFKLFTYVFISAVLGLRCCARAFSSRGEQGLLSSCGVRASRCGGFSCCGALAPGRADFNSCSTQAQLLWHKGSRLQTQELWPSGLVALWHVGSSQARDRTCVPCIGK